MGQGLEYNQRQQYQNVQSYGMQRGQEPIQQTSYTQQNVQRVYSGAAIGSNVESHPVGGSQKIQNRNDQTVEHRPNSQERINYQQQGYVMTQQQQQR